VEPGPGLPVGDAVDALLAEMARIAVRSRPEPAVKSVSSPGGRPHLNGNARATFSPARGQPANKNVPGVKPAASYGQPANGAAIRKSRAPEGAQRQAATPARATPSGPPVFPKPNDGFREGENGRFSQKPLPVSEPSTSARVTDLPVVVQTPEAARVEPARSQGGGLPEELAEKESPATASLDEPGRETRNPERQSPSPVPSMPGKPDAQPNLERLLRQHPDLPPQTMVLGVCEDGLPVLIDLNDPAPGAILVLGDERDRQIELLRTAVASVVTRATPHQVQFVILSCEPQAWQDWVVKQGFQRYSIAIENADVEMACDWVLRLADWTEQRRLGQRGGPAVLLVMDTLSFLPDLEYDVRLNFEWMAKEGPQAAIWPIAASSTTLARALSGRRLLRAFKTQVLGYARDPEDYVRLVNLDEAVAADLNQSGRFMVRAGENWLKFRLPG
jgi:hypothetical protein